jgi:hypothetical protein
MKMATEHFFVFSFCAEILFLLSFMAFRSLSPGSKYVKLLHFFTRRNYIPEEEKSHSTKITFDNIEFY